MPSGFEFLILYLLQNRIDFVLSLPKWILDLFSTNQSQNIVKVLFSAISISVISLYWNTKQVSSAYSNSLQSTVCGTSFIYNRKRSGAKMSPRGIPHRRLPGSKKVFLICIFNLVF